MTTNPPTPDDDVLSDAEESADVEHLSFHVTKNLVRRIDQYLTDRISYLSRAGVQRLISEGLVKVNGRIIKASYHPRDGDQIELVAPPRPVSDLVPEPIPLEVVYEDEHFMAINKQTNLMVHPARGVWTGTLVNGLVHYGQKWSTINGNWRPGILHRLDRNTTGIMLIAKSDEAHWRMARQFENRTIQKTYLAVVHGVPELLNDVIDLPIGRDRYVREKQAVRKLESGAKEAVTRYEVMETFGEGSGVRGQGSAEKRETGSGKRAEGSGKKWEAGSGKREEGSGFGVQGSARPHSALSTQHSALSPLNPEPQTLNPEPNSALSTQHSALSPLNPELRLIDSSFAKDGHFAPPPGKFSLVKLSPKTGRTHQLRVHMSARGYPMVGDTMYGGRIVEYGDFRFARQALHAYQISFVHPVTLEQMTLAAPMPADITRLLEILRGGPV